MLPGFDTDIRPSASSHDALGDMLAVLDGAIRKIEMGCVGTIIDPYAHVLILK
jgi:hypothetical protein